MKSYQLQLLRYSLNLNVLQFGEFTLRSGRVSPYFFNTSLFNTGKSLSELGLYCAQAIVESGIVFDTLFGPAYKGIPISVSTALKLYSSRGEDIPLFFNRKEHKDYGDGGNLVGAVPTGRVLIIDDVITDGAVIRESLHLLSGYDAKPVAVVVIFDRQERGIGELSATQEIEYEYSIPVISILCLSDLIDYIGYTKSLQPYLQAIRTYQRCYGVFT